MRCDLRFPVARLCLIDAARGTRIAGQRGDYGRSQWTATSALELIQTEKLRELLLHVQVHVPYYRRLAASGPLLRRDGDAVECLRALPVTLKEDMRRCPEDFRCLGARERVFERHTGGSTGTPFIYQADVPAMSGQWAGLLRAWEWSGYRFGDRMATVGGGSVSAPGGGGLRYRVYNLLRNNQTFAAADLDERGLRTTLVALGKVKPKLLYGYPSLLYLLASHARRQRAAVPRPRAIITTSEMLFPGQRKAIQEVFGAPVFDLYGCNEVNLVGAECELHDGWHYAMESTIVEILDEHDRPVLPGTVGRIVGTALDNRMMPFVRYDTGDLGSLDVSPCRCGRGLVRLRTLQGRNRDLVCTPDGRFVHGVAFNDLVLAYPWVDRYQAIQMDRRRLRVILACRQEEIGGEGESLRQRLAELTGLEVELAINEPFEVTAGQKCRVIVSKVPQGEGG